MLFGGDLAIRIEGSAQAGDMLLGKIGLTMEHEVKIGLPTSSNVERAQRDDKFTMLVDSVQIVNDPQRMISRTRESTAGVTVVRLQRLDEPESAVRNSLYFSFVSLNCVFVCGLANKDRELYRRRGGLSSLLRRELPSDVIQTRAQLVDDLAAKDAETDRDDTVSVGLQRLLDNLRIIIWDNRVGASFEKGPDLSFEIDDILVGSF